MNRQIGSRILNNYVVVSNPYS